MPSLIDFFNRQKRDVDKIVDITFWRLLMSEDPINQIMPIKNYPMRDLLMMKFSHSKPTIASIIAEDQEVPISRARMLLTEELLSDCKLGKAFGFTDKHYEMMAKFDMYLATNNIALSDAIKQYFFGIIASVAPAIVGRMTQMMFSVITTGQCVFTDPITLARVNLVYPGVDTDLMPIALTGAALWSAPTTATGLADLRTLARLYYDKFGKYPDNLIIRQQQIRQLSEMTSTKQAFSIRNSGTNASAGDLIALTLEDEAVITLIKQFTNVQNVEMFDAQYSSESTTGVITDSYYLPDGYIVYLDNGIVERAMVPTVEKDFAPGIFTLAERKSEIPRRDQIAGVGNGIPACFDDRKLCARKVA